MSSDTYSETHTIGYHTELNGNVNCDVTTKTQS